MKTLDAALAWALVVLGAIHAGAAFGVRPVTLGTVWFFSGGAAMIMSGLLNAVRVQSGTGGFVRGCSVAANLLMLAIILGFSWFMLSRLRHNPLVFAAWVAVGGELAFSLRGGR